MRQADRDLVDWEGGPTVERAAADLLHGAVGLAADKGGWVRPQRFTAGQLRAVGSCRAWHPGLFRSLAACTAGVSIEFETDSARVAVELRPDPQPRGSASALADVESHPLAPAAPYDGVSADVDGAHVPVTAPDDRSVLELRLERPSGSGPRPRPAAGGRRRVRVWLPSLTSCAVRRVVGDGTFIEPVAARGTLLVLGDSIAQGYVCCDPAASWPALLADHLGLDALNQGLGGQVFQPGSLAGLADAVSPEAVVVEFGANYRFEPCQPGAVGRDVRAFLDEVCEAWPDAPVWVVTPLPHLEDRYPTHPRSCAASVPGMIRAAVAAHRPQARVVEGSTLLEVAHLPRLLADGSDHPGPDAQRMVAGRLGFVIDALSVPAEERAARAREVLARLPEPVAFPLVECLRRGVGEAVFADPGAVLVRVGDRAQMLWAGDRKVSRRAVERLLGPVGCLQVQGRRHLRDVCRAAGLSDARPCHLAVFRGEGPLPQDRSLDVRVLTPAYEGAVLEHYSHPEYLAEGELADLLAAGAFLGGFVDGRLCGFVGEHPEGALGMLEVFPDHRGRGWGRALTSAKVNQQLELGFTPWAQVEPGNAASLGLLRGLGFEVHPEDLMWFLVAGEDRLG